jgi:hypothetical protein
VAGSDPAVNFHRSPQVQMTGETWVFFEGRVFTASPLAKVRSLITSEHGVYFTFSFH